MKGIEKFQEQLALVVGDMMVDRYIMGSVSRISPEAPVPVLQQHQNIRKLGGTGNVILNATSLGARVRAIGRVGLDPEGQFFHQKLQEFGVDDRYVFSEGNTIVKTRVSASNQQFIRIDEETIEPASKEIVNRISNEIESVLENVTVVILSDYAKGFITEELAQTIIKEAQKKNIPVLVDPKGKSAAKYRGATALTPNVKEFMDLTNLTNIPNEQEIKNSAWDLCRKNEFEYLVFTRSEKGISTITGKDGKKNDYPTVVKELVDVTGAGDTVVTTIALALASGFSLDESVKVANIAASIVISKFGASQTTIEELNEKIDSQSKKDFNKNADFSAIEKLKKQGKKIVFTNGCFDLVHAGHISSFKQAKALGDVLVVGVNSDESIRRIKGDKRPIVSLKNRIELLAALECVDFVIPFGEDTPQKLIEQICPQVLVKGKDWEGKEVAGGEFVRSHGGRVEFIELEQGLSTSSIIKKIKQAYADEG